MKIKSRALEVLLNDIELTDNKRVYIQTFIRNYHTSIRYIIKSRINKSLFYSNLVRDYFLKNIDNSTLVGEERSFLINYTQTVIKQLKGNGAIV